MAERKQTRRFLACVVGNFLTWLVSETTRKNTPLKILLTNRKGLVGDVKIGGCLGHNRVVE